MLVNRCLITVLQETQQEQIESSSDEKVRELTEKLHETERRLV